MDVQHRKWQLWQKIGTVGSMEVAETIFNALDVVSKETGVTFAFQGCEHINRAITIEKSQYNPLTMEEVSVVPDVHAGGSLATVAQHMKDPIVVEHLLFLVELILVKH